jgi:formamidopyrimidine-DNA glycosylase
VPELPEVETVVRELRPRLLGRRITAVTVSRRPLRRRWSSEWEQSLVGRKVAAIRRRGKWIILDLGGEGHLVIHLGMTGQLLVTDADAPLAEHTHLVFGLNRGRKQLRFRDIRRFGSATLFPSQTRLEAFFTEAGLGPEPFDLDPQNWRSRLAATGRCLKAVLLDQQVVAGVGNIYADEALFEARLHPAQLGRDTTARQAERLRRAVVTVLNRAIERRGSSIRNYVGGSGQKGRYQEEFRVYGRTGQPCPRCRTPIARLRLAGRSTHFCPRCQSSSYQLPVVSY